MEFIPYGRQYIDQDDIDVVVEALKSDWLTQGPKVKEFEDIVAAYHKCKYAVAFSNGTAALHGAYYVSTKLPFGRNGHIFEDTITNQKRYWEFITTPLSFVATANAGLYCGGKPKFVDINRKTYCIDIERIEDKITNDTRVITPVSFAGYPVDIKAIRYLPKVQENNICIIHDACHAIGAMRGGHRIADFADMTILSFHPVKHITTGEGGMVLTNNKDYYDMLLLFRNHGITKQQDHFIEEPPAGWYYEMQQLGYNYRITDIQCALGISQMKKLDSFLAKRNRIAMIYNEELEDIEWLRTPPGFDTITNDDYLITSRPDLHSYHLYPLLIHDNNIDRDEFYNYMHRNKIGIQVHYNSIENQIFYKKRFTYDATPNADNITKSIISIPMYPDLREDQLEYIITMIRSFINAKMQQ